MPHNLDILISDTLRCDSLSLVEWKSRDAFDYGRELMTPDSNVMEWLMQEFNRYMRRFFNVSVSDQYVRIVWIVVAVVLLCAVAYMFYHYRPKLFGRVGKDKQSFPEEDTIYGIDFENAIRRALDDGNYHEAVRMVYLQTLRYLSDNNYINWQIFKTPTQYIMEMRSDTFRTFTLHFIRVRYGNYDADVSLVETMQDLQDTLHQQHPPKDEEWKGGET